MEAQQLRHLILAAEHGSYLKASKAGLVSQSGLSRSIKCLEDRMGVQLLKRSRSGVQPTPCGKMFIRRAKVILNEIDHAVEDVRAIEEARAGEIRLGITQNYAGYLIPDLVSEVGNDQPDLRITIQTGGFVELIELVRSGALDFGFGVMGPLEKARRSSSKRWNINVASSSPERVIAWRAKVTSR